VTSSLLFIWKHRQKAEGFPGASGGK
jgi:hypothetical protein